MTNDLQRIVQQRLNSIKTEYGIQEISYRIGSDKQMFPHIVFDFTSITPTDMGRLDFLLDIDIWARDQFVAFQIMDAVRDLFVFWNAPDVYTNQDILPTFYEMSGGSVDDQDKDLVHLVLRLEGQTYKTGATDSGILAGPTVGTN